MESRTTIRLADAHLLENDPTASGNNRRLIRSHDQPQASLILAQTAFATIAIVPVAVCWAMVVGFRVDIPDIPE